MPRIDPPDQNDANDSPDMDDQDQPQDHEQNDATGSNDAHDQNQQQDHDDPDDARPEPLNPEEEANILDALTTGGRTMHSLGLDPTVRATFEQVRGAVRRARKNDPSFDERLPKRSRRPVPVIQSIVVLESDEAADGSTPTEAFVRLCSVIALVWRVKR